MKVSRKAMERNKKVLPIFNLRKKFEGNYGVYLWKVRQIQHKTLPALPAESVPLMNCVANGLCELIFATAKAKKNKNRKTVTSDEIADAIEDVKLELQKHHAKNTTKADPDPQQHDNDDEIDI